MTVIEAGKYVKELSVLRRMPKGNEANKALIEMFARIAQSSDHAEQIVSKMLDQYSDWPGPAALRQIATDTHPVRDRDQGEFLSRNDQWEREFREQVGGLCLQCNGYGFVHDVAAKRVNRCACPEGRPKWVDPSTGRVCPPDHYDAVEYNSDAELRYLNQWAQYGKKMPEWIAKAAQKKAPAREPLMKVPVACGHCGAAYNAEVAAAGAYQMKCQKCEQWFKFHVDARAS